MNQHFFSKFNQYDLFGYIMVGSIGILVLLFDLNFFLKIPYPSLDLNNIIIWFILVYFFGNIIQGLVGIVGKCNFIKGIFTEDKEKFEQNQKLILNQAKRYFKLGSVSYDYTWNTCNLFVISKIPNGYIESFGAYYSLYRGWLLVFFVQAIVTAIAYWNNKSNVNLSLLILSILISYVFYKRSKNFWNYQRDKVLQAFILFSKNY